MRRIQKVLVLLVGSCLGAVCSAYEVPTHELFTAEAVNRSKLTDGNLMLDIDMAGLDANYPVDGGFGLMGGRALVPYGARQEDGNTTDDVRRVFNHFYDVQFNNFAGRGMTVLWYDGNPSPTWALEDNAEVIDFENHRPQVFSARHLQQYYLQALTASSESERKRNFGLTLRAMGHVIHHVQDMAQPQHVRNDQHVHPIPWTEYNPAWAFYEQYSQRVLTAAKVASLVNTANYPVPSFPTSRQFWHTTGVTTGRYLGMAEFTANNYVSYGKNFRSTWQTSDTPNILPNVNHPLPERLNYDGTAKSVEPQNVTLQLMNGTQRTGTVDFVIGKVYDPYYGGVIPNQRLAGVSVLDMVASRAAFSAVSGRANVFTDNSVVYDDEHRVLVPRAVAFSAGLINHMLRGRLNLVRTTPTSTSWTVTNLSSTEVAGTTQGQPIEGMINLYYDDASGIRRPIPGASYAGVNLAYNASVNIGNTDPPSGATKVIAVFHGRIGSEGTPYADPATGFFAVAGKTVAYQPAPPPVPETICRQWYPYPGGTNAFGVSGDDRGMNRGVQGTGANLINPGPFQFGNIAGPIRLEWYTGWPGDRITIRRSSASGELLFDSGVASGQNIYTWNWTPAGDNKIFVRVDPPSGSGWGFHMNCPGGSITDAARVVREVSFSFIATAQTANCMSGHIDFYLDNAKVGTVLLPGGGAVTTTSFSGQHRIHADSSNVRSGAFGCSGPITLSYSYGGFNGPYTFAGSGANIVLP